ncbi:hypothetical protein Godav_006769, partial [Gossypium davidsonii]|nr:hypothetical protein [Gossypium davidsonii]MBA0656577.1 hypothetical protein [Gossypium klotzschianum]
DGGPILYFSGAHGFWVVTKVIAINEGNDIDTIRADEIIGSLQTIEMNIEETRKNKGKLPSHHNFNREFKKLTKKRKKFDGNQNTNEAKGKVVAIESTLEAIRGTRIAEKLIWLKPEKHQGSAYPKTQ